MRRDRWLVRDAAARRHWIHPPIADKLPFGRSASVHGVGIMVQPKPLVLVTGASGFIGSHCILALLGSNKFSVRGTVRSIGSKSTAHLTTHPGLKDATLVEADLLKDAGWDAAVAGCDYVLHVASLFPIGKVPENSLVQPAVEGTERVLRAAAKNKVKRVVLTSSVAAVSGGRADGDVEERTFKEDAWSNPDKQDEYGKSKTLGAKGVGARQGIEPRSNRHQSLIRPRPGTVRSFGLLVIDDGAPPAQW